ncbi:alpha-galactosidase [Paenibacillus agaridevorans]|nr:glycoside hydrolase family 36 protein [Paenibacillus agaridevorans]
MRMEVTKQPDQSFVQCLHEKMVLRFEQTENGYCQSLLNTDDGRMAPVPIALPGFQLAIAGMPHGALSSMVSGMTSLPSEMKLESMKQIDDQRLVFLYFHDKLQLSVEVEMHFIPNAAVIRQSTTVRNNSNRPVVLTHLSSTSIQGIATDGCRPWYDKNKIRVHYCRQSWNGEGQWRSGDLEELGLFPSSVHGIGAAIHFASYGSQSTSRYLPMIVLEDMETGKSWYMQIETSANWHIEVGYRGTSAFNKGALFLHADGASERYGGWTHELLPGESFTAVPVAVGCCMGDFTDAVKQLTKYRRSFLKPSHGGESESPLIFNDYMNCLWADPTKDKLIPQIDAAAAAGAECYCIDAGWFAKANQSWGTGLGDWKPSEDRFGDEGLQGIFDYIRQKGLRIGIWLEMEVCGEDAELGQKPDSWFLMRNGARVGGGPRWFLNFTNPEVTAYLHQIIDQLVGMGASLIRNDCNDCIGNGDDHIASSAADGLIQNMRAFYAFIEEVKTRHSHILLENCGSGGMRSDYGILSRFHLHSTSDQEAYYNNPSIIGGLLAAILPEQAGFWTYPYPLLFHEKEQQQLLTTQDYQSNMSDGEQTIFNMINGMCGSMYLSGHIEAADELNWKLIQEGVALYKRERKHIRQAYPVWPIGFTRLNDKNGWACVGLASEDQSRILLAVWRLGSAESYIELQLPNEKGNRKTSIKQLYPSGEQYQVRTYYNTYSCKLTVHLPQSFQARYFEVTRE